MDPDIIERLQTMFKEEDCCTELEERMNSLVGRFLTTKPFNRRAAKNTICPSWGLGNNLKIVEVGLWRQPFPVQV